MNGSFFGHKKSLHNLTHRVLATVKNFAVKAIFPISPIEELPNFCYPNI